MTANSQPKPNSLLHAWLRVVHMEFFAPFLSWRSWPLAARVSAWLLFPGLLLWAFLVTWGSPDFITAAHKATFGPASTPAIVLIVTGGVIIAGVSLLAGLLGVVAPHSLDETERAFIPLLPLPRASFYLARFVGRLGAWAAGMIFGVGVLAAATPLIGPRCLAELGDVVGQWLIIGPMLVGAVVVGQWIAVAFVRALPRTWATVLFAEAVIAGWVAYIALRPRVRLDYQPPWSTVAQTLLFLGLAGGFLLLTYLVARLISRLAAALVDYREAAARASRGGLEPAAEHVGTAAPDPVTTFFRTLLWAPLAPELMRRNWFTYALIAMLASFAGLLLIGTQSSLAVCMIGNASQLAGAFLLGILGWQAAKPRPATRLLPWPPLTLWLRNLACGATVFVAFWLPPTAAAAVVSAPWITALLHTPTLDRDVMLMWVHSAPLYGAGILAGALVAWAAGMMMRQVWHIAPGAARHAAALTVLGVIFGSMSASVLLAPGLASPIEKLARAPASTLSIAALVLALSAALSGPQLWRDAEATAATIGQRLLAAGMAVLASVLGAAGFIWVLAAYLCAWPAW